MRPAPDAVRAVAVETDVSALEAEVSEPTGFAPG